MTLELYRDRNHCCLMFSDLIEENGHAVQANPFLIIDEDAGALIDPGGNLAFNELFMAVSRHFPPRRLSYLTPSPSDPDFIGSLDRWISSPADPLVISSVSDRFAPPFTKVSK